MKSAAVFFRTFCSDPDGVGALLPSSQRLARALVAPFASRSKPARVLEVGAGTGAVTNVIGKEMRDGDELHVCEIHAKLLAHVQEAVLTRAHFEPSMRSARVKLHNCPIQQLQGESEFDFIISGLPFTAFKPQVITETLDVIARLLRPGGVFSYFEYVGLRRARRWFAIGASRTEMIEKSRILDEHIAQCQFARRTVFFNLPPAHVRYWRMR